MKKIITTAVLFAFIASSAMAQITKPSVIKKQVAPAPAPAPAPVYTLTAVKANIRTGNDNKEFPSEVTVGLSSRNGNIRGGFVQKNLRNEMKSNSNTEFGLQKSGTGDLLLTDLQNSGIIFTIYYSANFQFDAWKIEGVTLTLEFRDQQGNLHPTLGQKTITFGNANGFLNGYFERRMECTTDGYFNPLSAAVITTK